MSTLPMKLLGFIVGLMAAGSVGCWDNDVHKDPDPCPTLMKCSDGQCHECCDDEDCAADEVCNQRYECQLYCEMEVGSCWNDRGGCCDPEVCDPFLDRCVYPCGEDADCSALHGDLPFAADMVCQADGTCDFQHCSTDADCRSGTVCYDGDCVASTCGLDATCVIAPGYVVVGNGCSARMVAWPLLRSGRMAPGVDFTWESSDPDIATVSDGVVTGGLVLGTATITATAVDCGFACTAEVRNLSGFFASTRVVVVDELSGEPVPLAAVEIEGCCAAETDSAGVATFDEPYLPGAPATVTVSAAGYGQLSFMQAATSDIIAPLRRQPDPPAVGGFGGRFDFDRIFCQPGDPCEVKVGLAGASIPGNPFSLGLDELVGELMITHIELGGTSEDVPLPGGLVLGLNDTWFRKSFEVTGAPGNRVAWGLGGKLNLADLIEILGPVISGDEPDMGAVLGALVPLVGDFHTGVVPHVEIEPVAKVPDLRDINGDGSMDDLVPDYGDFPALPTDGLALKVPTDQVTNVSVPPLPSDGADGYLFDLVIVIGGVQVVDAGFVPLGVSAGSDLASEGDTPDGLVAPIELATSEVAGRLPAGSYQRVVVALAVDLDGLFDPENEAPLVVAGQIHEVDSFDDDLALRPFMAPPVHEFDPNSRTVTIDSAPADLDAILMLGRQAGRTWQVFHPGFVGALELPPEPAGGDWLDHLDLAALRFADGIGYAGLISFNEVNLAGLAQVVSDFVATFAPGR